eukprot:TRINITY_DN4267_c0_g1_i1.p1 TRINITY_DN4267_c0_g1~~TRINITY_DN4267_c0_g1_i1.p1  ORF type:complete len:603 (-),score=182.98 TRINITY_DN4267_c0_g1_i1:67-1875(-)
MGVGCGPKGLVHVTDMDTIEKSNLSRQFLFRDSDLGQMKSKTAAKAAKTMNPNFNVKFYEIPVETEETFDENFWKSLDLVVNALDNLKARKYTDANCVMYGKPLLESGTLGTKANTQVVIPHKTESYGASPDAPEKTYPMCTLKHYPNMIEHTIEWARDVFGGLFKVCPEDINTFLEKPDFFDALKKSSNLGSIRMTAESMNEFLSCAKLDEDKANKNKILTFTDCVIWARLKFQEYFYNTIAQLVYNLPANHRTKEGAMFWSGPKRFPQPIAFDPEEELHMEFINSASHLFAFIYNVPDEDMDEDKIKQILKTVTVPVFTPKKAFIPTDPNDKGENNNNGNTNNNTTEDGNGNTGGVVDDDEQYIENTQKKLDTIKSKLGAFRLTPVVFEKDDDTNHHMSFITSCSNLRARNYTIPEATFQKTKQIAGRIIPALATTTSCITGLVMLELYKLFLTPTPRIEMFKNSFLNLALPLFAFSEPLAPLKHTSKDDVKAVPENWTQWDVIEMEEKGEGTLRDVVNRLKNEYGVEVNSITGGEALMYVSFMAAHASRLDEKVVRIWERVNKKELPAMYTFLTLLVEGTDLEGDLSIDMPELRYRFRK